MNSDGLNRSMIDTADKRERLVDSQMNQINKMYAAQQNKAWSAPDNEQFDSGDNSQRLMEKKIAE